MRSPAGSGRRSSSGGADDRPEIEQLDDRPDDPTDRRHGALRPPRRAARPAPPCWRPAPAPARPTPSARWSRATSPRARARLDEMLVITFGRAASQELRERVRDQLVEAERPWPTRPRPRASRRAGRPARRGRRRRRRRPPQALRDALADFDAATIATTHQFCQLVLRSLGVAGDTDSGRRARREPRRPGGGGGRRRLPAALRPPARRPAVQASGRPRARAGCGPRPAGRARARDAEPGSAAHERLAFAEPVRAEVERRKRRLGILSYDDLLSRLADALEDDDSPARQRMRQRWRIVLVDEFQDTDPVQWKVLDRAFSGDATMVLIGDPKQAIYAFRGGDIFTYLEAAETAATRRTLAVNWRSDEPLVDALQALLGGAALGDPRIGVHPVEAHAPRQPARGARRSPTRCGCASSRADREGDTHADRRRRARTSPQDLADDVARLLASGATFEGRPARGRRRGDPDLQPQARRPVPGAPSRRAASPRWSAAASSVLLTEAGADWLALLEALEQPHRSARVRSVALTPFVGLTAEQLDAGGDDLTDDVAERVRRWLDLLRTRGIAAVHEAIVGRRPGRPRARQPDGERLLTDLDHLGQVLHEVPHRERLGPAGAAGVAARGAPGRRSQQRAHPPADTDAPRRAVRHHPRQQGPAVPRRLPAARSSTSGRPTSRPRCSTTTPASAPSTSAAPSRARSPPGRGAEAAGEELRLTYVALTRAQSQVVTWWAPTCDAVNAGLTRLLLGRARGESAVPDRRCRRSRRLEVGGRADRVAGRRRPRDGDLRAERGVRLGARRAGPRSRRTPVRPRRGHRVAAHVVLRADPRRGAGGPRRRQRARGRGHRRRGRDRRAPRAGRAVGHLRHRRPALPDGRLPAGATFGSLVHGVLEHADPDAPDLGAELPAGSRSSGAGGRSTPRPPTLAEALLPMQHTPLGPLADGRTLAEIGARRPAARARLRVPARRRRRDPTRRRAPLRDGRGAAPPPPRRRPDARLRRAARVARRWATRPCAATSAARSTWCCGWATATTSASSSSTTRPTGSARSTSRSTALDYTQALMTEAMLHSHYPLQALLYSVVLHRYLRWRLRRLRPRAAPRRHPLPLRARHVRTRDPEVDGLPCGVFSWHPPAAMVVELSDAARRPARLRAAGEEGLMTLTEDAVWADAHDRRLALGATGLLAHFNQAEVLHAADVHVALRLGDLLEENDEEVLLATALAVRAVRTGLGLPRPGDDRRGPARGRRGPALAGARRLDRARRPQPAGPRGDAAPGRDAALPRPLLARGGAGLRRPGRPHPPHRRPRSTQAALDAGVLRVFPHAGYDEQRAAARAAASRWTTVLTGGPGTGKTTTVAGLLALVAEQHELATGRSPRIALAAPTGKAAARLQEAVQEATAKLEDATDRQRLAGLQRLHAAPAARLAARQPGAVPARPRPTGCPTTWSWSTRPRWSR